MFFRFFDQIKDFMMYLDTNKTIIGLNQSASLLIGAAKEEIIGKNFYELYKYLPKEEIEKCREGIERALSGEQSSKCEYRLIYNKKGERKNFIFHFDLIKDNDNPVGVAIVGRDLTDIEDYKYRTLADSSTDGIISIDKDGKIIFWNKAAENILGYKEDEILGKHIFTLMSSKFRDTFKFNEASEHINNTNKLMEIEMIDKNGETVPVEISIFSTINENGIVYTIIMRDISYRKRMEKELKEARDHFKMLFNTIVDPVVVVDSKGKFLDITEKLEEVTGFKREELLGKNFLKTNIVTSKSKKILIENLMKRMIGIKVPPYEIEALTKDGRKIPFEVNAEPIIYKGKKADLVVFRDISERKNIEKKLIEKEEDYRAVVENSHEGIFIINDSYKFTYANKELCKILNYNIDEIINRDFRDFLDEDSKKIVEDRYVRRQRGEKVPSRYEFTVIDKYGRKKIVELSSSVIRDSSGKVKTVGQILDITEKKKILEELKNNEEKFRTISESANDAIIMMDSEGNVSYWNRAAEKMFGYKNDEVIGKNIHELLAPPRFHDAHKQAFKKFKETGKGAAIGKTIELSALHKDGTEFPVELSLSSIKLNDKWNAIGIIRNIKERKDIEKKLHEKLKELKEVITEKERAEKKIKELNKDLERKVKERTQEIGKLLKQKDDFVNQLGHDLKTPLTPLIALLPLVKEKEKDPQLKKLVDIALRNANYMKSLITDTLKLAKLNSSNISFEIDDINLETVVDEILEDNKPLFDNYRINVIDNIDNVIVKADRLRIKEVFNNIITNSIRYMPDGGTLTIDTDIKDKDGEVIVKVIDTGEGLEEKQKEKIFDEFYKTDLSRHDLTASGLGLTICKKIVEKHGGRIWAESEGKGKGTTINFTLPLGNKGEKGGE